MYNVLLVDDEPGYLFLYQNLRSWGKCGFTIAATAANGAEALTRLEKGRFDLVFTDIRMPFMDGVELLKQLRQRGQTDLPVIFASSFSDFSYAHQGILHGLFDYLLKPIDEKTLENALNRVKEYLTGQHTNRIDKVMADLLRELNIQMENDDYIFQVCAFCSEHYREPFALADFAAIFGYSNDHFSRLFRQHFGLSFKEFTGRVKVAYAIDYLRQGGYTVGEISELLGFLDVNHFRTLFKSITGVQPIDYKPGVRGGQEP